MSDYTVGFLSGTICGAVIVWLNMRGDIKSLRKALKHIRMVAGNKMNPEADKAVIRGIVTDILGDGDK